MIDLNRKERALFIKSQQRNPKVLTKSKPLLGDMQEGVPIYTEDSSGIKQYIRLNNIMYESALTRTGSLENSSSIVFVPAYDSGWVNAGLNTAYNFDHNLNSKLLKSELYFRADGNSSTNGLIFNVTSSNIHEIFDDPTGDNSGTQLTMSTLSRIIIDTSDASIFTTEQGTKNTSGHLRLVLWKTGLID